MTNLYPVFLDLPENFPDEEVPRPGLAAHVRLYSDRAGIVGSVATAIQWIQTSIAYLT